LTVRPARQDAVLLRRMITTALPTPILANNYAARLSSIKLYDYNYHNKPSRALVGKIKDMTTLSSLDSKKYLRPTVE